MAGAISAGAYTAGAIDFLIEALDDYTTEKARPGWTGPTHDVFVPVIGGASAGGMTAGLTALSLFRELSHVRPGEPPPKPEENRLYSSWVDDISMNRLLEVTDLSRGREMNGVMSALCCDVLDEILDDAFELTKQERSRPWVGGPHGDALKVILTVSNLRGVPYAFRLLGDAGAAYGMLNHADYVEFDVSPGSGGTSHVDPLDLANAPSSFKAACLATGAFPIGLAPRLLTQRYGAYAHGHRVVYRDKTGQFHPIPPEKCLSEDADYTFVAVDGGMIDNEPFELVRRALSGGPAHSNERAGVDATKAVLLIDPFPNTPKLPALRKLPNGQPDRSLLGTLKTLLPTLVGQARFKPDELAPILDENVYSRFVIAPSRNEKGSDLAIACGALGGFGGFLHHSFRRHDYLLGRRNAQAFLRWTFGLPETNPLFEEFDASRRPDWYVTGPKKASDGGNGERQLEIKSFAVSDEPGSPEEKGLPIIPLTERMKAPIEIEDADRPRPEQVDLDQLRLLIDRRAGHVLQTLADRDLAPYLSRSPLVGWILRKAAVAYGRRIVTNAGLEQIKASLDQIKKAFSVIEGKR
ncbi:patatin [Rhodoplanes azumiensis]|uniref:Patatin n=1 Tax=Rhodoplanes azumiensis TaxID=1897628 RepID=A0ABW5AGD4_9BRAD